MPDQYMNFSNPTIIPANPSGWQALNNSTQNTVKTFSDYLLQRQAEIRALQLGQAQSYGDAQSKVWANLQDPIARALTMGKLGEMGFPINNMSGGNVPSMSQMLQGNPYASYVSGGGQQGPFTGNSSPSMQPSSNMNPSTVPMGGQPANFNSLNPITSPTAPNGSNNPEMVQEQVKMSPFGTPLPGVFTNVDAGAKVQAAKSYADKIAQSQGSQTTATAMLDSITRNLAADLKAHFIEAGGGGPIKGNITGFSTKIGMSPATYGLQNTVRDSAIAYARDLAGGSPGVQRLFQSIVETIPQVGTTQDQAGTALLQMHLTAVQLQAGIQKLGLKPQDLSNMNDEQIQNVMNSGTIDRDAETKRFSNLMSTIKPTKVMGMNGQFNEPTLNPILGMFGVKGQTNNSNPTQSQPNNAGSQYVKTGTLPDGRRVGIKQDGTPEIISGQ